MTALWGPSWGQSCPNRRPWTTQPLMQSVGCFPGLKHPARSISGPNGTRNRTLRLVLPTIVPARPEFTPVWGCQPVGSHFSSILAGSKNVNRPSLTEGFGHIRISEKGRSIHPDQHLVGARPRLWAKRGQTRLKSVVPADSGQLGVESIHDRNRSKRPHIGQPMPNSASGSDFYVCFLIWIVVLLCRNGRSVDVFWSVFLATTAEPPRF